MQTTLSQQARSLRKRRLVLYLLSVLFVAICLGLPQAVLKSVEFGIAGFMFISMVLMPFSMSVVMSSCPHCHKLFFGDMLHAGARLRKNSCVECGFNIKTLKLPNTENR